MKYVWLFVIFQFIYMHLYFVTFVEKDIQCLEAEVEEQRQLTWLLASIGKSDDEKYIKNYTEARNKRVEACR